MNLIRIESNAYKSRGVSVNLFGNNLSIKVYLENKQILTISFRMYGFFIEMMQVTKIARNGEGETVLH